jgi:hypothetical protein
MALPHKPPSLDSGKTKWRTHSCVKYQDILYTQSQDILYTEGVPEELSFGFFVLRKVLFLEGVAGAKPPS